MAKQKSGRAGVEISNDVKFKWNEGDAIQGHIIGVHEDATEDDRTFKVYVIDAADGVVNFVLNDSMWSKIKRSVCFGDLIRVEFKGRKEIGKGQELKLFSVVVIEENPSGKFLYTAFEPASDTE